MKILYITTRFFPHVGGVENVVQNLAKFSLEKGNDICVISSKSTSGKDLFSKVFGVFKVSNEVEVLFGYKVKRIWMNLPRSILGFISFVFKFPLSIILLIKFVKRYDPDVINYHFPDDSSLYVYFLSLFVKKPIVLSIHGNDLQVFSKTFPYKIFINRIIGNVSKVVVNSDYMKAEFISSYTKYKDKVEIINNGIDLKLFDSIKKKEYFKEPYIFFVGRFVHKKGIDVLIDAFSKINKTNYKLLIEGIGDLLQSSIDKVKKLKLEDRVIFTKGSLNEKNKIEYMKGATIGVMPSRIEPFGVVALEFMASKTPLIASKTGGLVSIIEDNKTGIFFENGNVNDLTSKIEKLCDDKKLREKLEKNSLNEVKKYSWENITKLYLSLFESLK